MTLSLASFQDAFIHSLYGQAPSALPALREQPGFMVYRNTVMKGASDALVANFPTVEQLVGTDWLQAAARLHAQQSPPEDARLLFYGAGFPDFLDHFEPAAQLPYLGNVARLDRLWTEVHSAPDEDSLDVATFIDLTSEPLKNLQLRPKASVRWQWFADQPACTIWRCNREQVGLPENLDWCGEGILITRHVDTVTWQSLSAEGCAFLDACTAGLPMDQAIASTLDMHPKMLPEVLLVQLLSADVFAFNNHNILGDTHGNDTTPPCLPAYSLESPGR